MFGMIDIIALILLLLFTLSGFASGFVRAFGNLVGFVLGFIVASWFLTMVADQVSFTTRPILTLIIFLLIAAIVSFIIGWVIDLIEQLRKIISIIPFLKTINRLLGAVFGFAEGLLTLAAIIFFARFFLPETNLKSDILGSQTAEWLSGLSQALQALIFF